MKTSLFLTHLSQVACIAPDAEENAGPKTAIKATDIKYDCPTTDGDYATCAAFTNYTYPREPKDYAKKGSVGWSFGHKMSKVKNANDVDAVFKPSFTVDVTMTIPYDPVFLIEMSNIKSADDEDRPFIVDLQSGALGSWRWTQPGNVVAGLGDVKTAVASPTLSPNIFVCPYLGGKTGGGAWDSNITNATTLLDLKDITAWDANIIKLTTMLLSNAQVKQGYFEFKGISEFPCAVCAPNVTSGVKSALEADYLYPFDLWLLGDAEFSPTVSTTPDETHAIVFPPGRTAAPACTKETHSHVYGSNTPGIFKVQKITQAAAIYETPYATDTAETAVNETENHSMTMNLDYLHIRSIIYGENAPQATVQLETFPTAKTFLDQANGNTNDDGEYIRSASFFVVAVQAGLYNLGGFFNASADSLKEGIRFGFTDRTTETDSTDLDTVGFLHFQYTLLPPSDLIAATAPEKSPGLAVDPEAACQTAEDAADAVKDKSIVELIANNDKLTYQLIKQGETALEATANNYGFQSLTEKVFNACGEIGGASMYVFADAPVYLSPASDDNPGAPNLTTGLATLPWMRGQVIPYGANSTVTSGELTKALSQMIIGTPDVKRTVDFTGIYKDLNSSLYPKMILSYAMSYLQMNAVDGAVVGAVPFVSTEAPGPAWTKTWKFQDATGISGFSDATLIDADFDYTPSVNYHIGGGSWMMIIIICSVVAALLLAGVGYYFYTNKGDSAQAASAGSVADDTDEA